MKTVVLASLFLFTGSGAFAADTPAPTEPASAAAPAFAAEDAPPEWRGMFVLGDARRFALSTPGGTQSAWIAVGESFNDWKLVEYREKSETLLIRKEGLDIEIPLASSKIVAAGSDAKATIAQAEALMRQMNFTAMFEKVIEQQKKTAVAMTRQAMAQDKNAANIDQDEMAAFQEKVMDVMWSAMDPEQMSAEMAAAYAEVFTSAELQGMAEFYATSAGKATLEKAPELQERMMQSMMPRLMAAMPKVRRMSQEFAAEQKAKRAAAAAAATPETPAHPHNAPAANP